MIADYAFSYAPGKLILSGEHAVVYGHPAIAATLDRGIRIAVAKKTFVDGKHSRGPTLRATGLGFVCDVKPDPAGEGPEVLRKALTRLVELFGERVSELELVVESAIPGGRGLGSSASLSVAMIRGVCRFFGETISCDIEAELAMELERIFHGNPSGIDHTVITRGGLLRYEKTESIRVEPIICPRPLRFAVGLASPHGGTLQAVQALKERFARHQKVYEHAFTGIRQIVEEMQMALTAGKLYAVGELMNLNQGYLNALGVSTPELEALCGIARNRGALGAKLTGAGCGGAVIALVDGDPTDVADAFRAAGFLAFLAECKTN